MMKRAGGGGNVQKNDAGRADSSVTDGETSFRNPNNQSTVAQNNEGVRTNDQTRRGLQGSGAANPGVGAGGSNFASSGGQGGTTYSTSASSGGGGSTAANYAEANRAEENALAAQKAQQSSTSTTAATANYAATNTTSSTASTGSTTSNTGTTTASTGSNPSTVSNSTSSDGTVRLANKGIGDDSAAIKQKYAGRMGVNSPNRTV